MFDEFKLFSEMLEDEEFVNLICQDIFVFKSFVEDVFVFNEMYFDFFSFILDMIDCGVVIFSIILVKNFNEGDLDMSFLDNDLLEISDWFWNLVNVVVLQVL